MQKYVFKAPKKNVFSTGAKVVGGLAISISLLAFGFSGGISIREILGSLKNESKCESLIKYYYDDGICLLPKTIYIGQAYDLKYSSGAELLKALKANNIECCKIGDDYYTQTPQEITVVTIQKSADEEVNVNKIALENQIIYTVPDGYTYEKGRVYSKSAPKIEEKIILNKVEKVDNLFPNNTILNSQIIQTKAFNELKYTDFVFDVNDDATNFANSSSSNTYKATLKLIPKNW